ncbi:LytTR family DNA-binding domain-containing protein [Segetibacter sp.]|jgi:two-component system LytT family response regulator|uniref:LytR/AlgR family response regulator transcription factor n=1 Tax=Segetibacter sp. TaxID=2231182 RepID=UPI0026340D09|nr:LytTR family DNA-binding domain-containing protein [Segetibacter sp.]MCW3080308.1 response regulator transcription factor [Segetibacter sp.]
MLRCIAIDDEDLALELMEDYISKVPYLQLVATCDDPLDAIGIIQEKQIDLVFLDIQMPGLNGLQLIESLSNNPMCILVTAYSQYALDGFNLNVVDYLVKPVPFDRFLKACNKARGLYQLKHKATETSKEEKLDYFFINADYSHVKITYADILWVEGLKDYIKIHLGNNARPVVARISMKNIEELLPSSKFLRIQKSYIVSKAHITAVKKTSVFIGSTELSIGENYKDSVLAFLGRKGE